MAASKTAKKAAAKKGAPRKAAPRSSAKASTAKTVPAPVSVDEFLAQVPDAARRAECAVIDQVMREATGDAPVMWGPSIVGYGSYHYVYDSGHEGDMCRIGFSPRKSDLVIYIVPGFETYGTMLDKLGKHKLGKSCLYIKRLTDVDLKLLEQLIRAAVKDMRRKYP